MTQANARHVKAAFAQALGLKVSLCGTRKNGKPWA